MTEATARDTREAPGQPVAEVLDEAIQARDRLARIPCANWCPERAQKKAKTDMRVRSGGSARISIGEW